MTHLQLLRTREECQSQRQQQQEQPTHTSGCDERGQVTDVWIEPNSSDALSGGSYELKLRRFKDRSDTDSYGTISEAA
jgi:hypothetical protein